MGSGARHGQLAGGRGATVTLWMQALAPVRSTASIVPTSSATSMSEPAMYLRVYHSVTRSAAASRSQPSANSVSDSPSPPEQSPTTTRVKPICGCSARHASTSLSSAALLTA